jgi:hypothetical protein
MSILNGLFGMSGGFLSPYAQNAEQANEEMWRRLNGTRRPYLEYNPAQGIPMQYVLGIENNRRVMCAYCRTPRMSMHHNCKGCGATEVMG